jgi:hypothetical protein
MAMARVTRATAPRTATPTVTAWMKMPDNCSAVSETLVKTDTDGDGTIGDACDSDANG